MYDADVTVLFVIMDSFEESASSQKPMRLDCDNDKSRNSKGTPRQCSARDDNERLFTSMSTQAGPSCSTQNGPRNIHSNSLSSNESGQSSKLSENNDYYRNSSSECNRVSSSGTCTEQGESPRSAADSSACDNCVEPSPEVQSCQRHKVCMDRAGINHNQPSTSGPSKSAEVAENSCKENRKRPSSLKLNRPNLEDDSSSDTGNDDYSLGSEDGCIYTYRGGGHLADLPSSFFSLDMGLPLDKHLPILPNYPGGQQGAVNARDRNSRASSPDMDFLEMDFDPGPSCEADSGEESSPDAELEAACNMPEENEPVMRGVSPEYAGARINPPIVIASSDASICYDVPSTSRGVSLAQGDVAEEPRSNHVFYGPYITHVNARGEQILVRRTMCHWPHNAPISLHVSSGDLVSPREMLNYEEDTERPFAHQINQGERPTFDSANLSSALYHMTMAKRLMVEKTRSDIENYDSVNMAGDAAACSSVATSSGASCAETPRSMVWSEREACERQVTQIATSACGATAVVNVFIALGVPVNIEKINSAVNTRQRANNAPLPRYLLSRAVAGCTAADLVNGIQRASDGLVTARFFPTYPERAMSLSHWLADWISLGAVPILTLNLQVGCDGVIPDAWHHQMVFGVSSRGVYLCNPVECVRETALWPRLTSPSVLLVRTRDVISRFTATTDLTPLMAVPDRRFHAFNVLGQVVNVVREWRANGSTDVGIRTRHIRIPAAYQAGVTVAALTGTEAHKRLSLAAQLPILAPQIDPDK